MTDQSNGQPSVVVERTLEAPVSLVWQMWTDPEHFKAWYGPTGSTIPVAEMDVRVGGRRFVGMAMETPDGPMTMWFTGEYLEVTEPTRLVYTESMADADGTVRSPASMGMPAGHPETTEVIVELTSDGGRTHMVMTHVGVPADSGGAMGWSMALDALEGYLRSLG